MPLCGIPLCVRVYVYRSLLFDPCARCLRFDSDRVLLPSCLLPCFPPFHGSTARPAVACVLLDRCWIDANDADLALEVYASDAISADVAVRASRACQPYYSADINIADVNIVWTIGRKPRQFPSAVMIVAKIALNTREYERSNNPSR